MKTNLCWQWQRSANDRPIWIRFDNQLSQWQLTTGHQDFDIPFKHEHLELFIEALERYLATAKPTTFKRAFSETDVRNTEVNKEGCKNNIGNCILLDDEDKYRLLLVLRTLHILHLIASLRLRMQVNDILLRHSDGDSLLPRLASIKPISWSWIRSANNKPVWIKPDLESEQWLITTGHEGYDIPFKVEHLSGFLKAIEQHLADGHAQSFKRIFANNNIRNTEVNSVGLTNNCGNTIAMDKEDKLHLYSVLMIYETLLVKVKDFREEFNLWKHLHLAAYSPASSLSPLSSYLEPPHIFGTPPILRTPLCGGGFVDYTLGKIYGHPGLPEGAFLDSLGNVRHPLTGDILGRLHGDKIVPPHE
jgi:hypothetical protein